MFKDPLVLAALNLVGVVVISVTVLWASLRWLG
jgi:hypothetical protein